MVLKQRSFSANCRLCQLNCLLFSPVNYLHWYVNLISYFLSLSKFLSSQRFLISTTFKNLCFWTYIFTDLIWYLSSYFPNAFCPHSFLPTQCLIFAPHLSLLPWYTMIPWYTSNIELHHFRKEETMHYVHTIFYPHTVWYLLCGFFWKWFMLLKTASTIISIITNCFWKCAWLSRSRWYKSLVQNKTILPRPKSKGKLSKNVYTYTSSPPVPASSLIIVRFGSSVVMGLRWS